jgi:hypothetical protein
MTGGFSSYVALLSQFLERRGEIVAHIEGRLLNVRGKDTSRNRNRDYFDHMFTACFFNLPGLPRDLSRLKGQLAAAHVADGFEPILLKDRANELDPLDLIVRAYQQWEEHRWPGHNGRLTYAHTLYAVFLLRQLEHLSLRIWDEGSARAEDRLHEVQQLLDRLNEGAQSAAFIRDVRWLIHTAQGPLTAHLRPYFRIAGQISESFTDSFRLGLHNAGARLTGGHLRSQLRYRTWETRRAIDDPDILAVTRNSNSMDLALLVRDLVPLLGAYRTACLAEDVEARPDLADAILQGLSADPELLLTRLDLLAPCAMIEDLFVDRDDEGRARYTPLGRTHRGLLDCYGELIRELAAPLKEDAVGCDPSTRAYSPFAIAYGFCSDILANMALDTLVSQPSLGLSLEDIFVSRGALDDKLARSEGWKRLPTRQGERKHFDHSAEWAEQMWERVVNALDARARRTTPANASSRPDGRLFVVPEAGSLEACSDGTAPGEIVSAQEYCFTSDLKLALSGATTAVPKKLFLTDRNEGRFLASAESDGKWFGISKVILSVITGQGKDALVSGVPAAAIDALRLTCPGLLMLPNGSTADSSAAPFIRSLSSSDSEG